MTYSDIEHLLQISSACEQDNMFVTNKAAPVYMMPLKNFQGSNINDLFLQPANNTSPSYLSRSRCLLQ